MRMKLCHILGLAIFLFTAPSTTRAADDCPPFPPLENKKLEGEISARGQGLARFLASGDFSAKFKHETQAAYALAPPEVSFDTVKYAMLATICRQIAKDDSLSGAQKASHTVKLMQEAGK